MLNLFEFSEVELFDLCKIFGNLEDLSLDFSVPGFPDLSILNENSSIFLDRMAKKKKLNRVNLIFPTSKCSLVTLETLQTYVYLLSKYFLSESTSECFAFIQEGFSSICNRQILNCFFDDELPSLFTGSASVAQKWDFSFDTIRSSVILENGFTFQTPVILWFMELIADFDLIQQKEFIRFLTGAPCLPVGGLKSLKPQLTVSSLL